jgi:hypothetical protein
MYHDLSIPQLRADLNGRVIAPGDAAYDRARTTFYGGIDRRPRLIIRAEDVSEVSRAVALARDNGLPLAVRSGGHSFAGHSVVDGGIVLDLSAMKVMDVDPGFKIAWAQTGLTAGEYTETAACYGLATGFGDTGTVGIGGITLGGGVGFLSRKHGLTIDSLLAAEMVMASGEVLHVDADTHPDLFWAIRGGGGNFGVATRFLFRLHEVDTIVGGMLILPATVNALASFIAAADAAPDELSTIANVMPAPPMPFVPPEHHGKMILMGMLVYAGDVESGERAIAPFRTLTEPLADMVRPMRYPEIFMPEEEDYHPTAAARTLFIDTVDRDIAGMLLEYLNGSDAPMRVAQLRVLGGAVARVPNDATAYAHRQARIMVNVAAFYEGPEDRPLREAWVADLAAALNQGYSGAYVNFVGDEGQARVGDAYPGATWDRLAAVKARYDPTNLFRMNHNIPPGAEARGG